jgi:hypothetical protein
LARIGRIALNAPNFLVSMYFLARPESGIVFVCDEHPADRFAVGDRRRPGARR